MATGRSANDVTFQSQLCHSGAGSIARRLRCPRPRHRRRCRSRRQPPLCRPRRHRTQRPHPPHRRSRGVTNAGSGRQDRDRQGKITSKALAGNLLGDPATRTYSVLLPPSYATSDKRYPVVYVLHWYTGKDYSMVGPMLVPYKTLLREDKVQEMIFVFPDASNKLGGSQYLSSPTIGDYETYITQELVDLVDATYRTIPDRNSRGITGCSMGGDRSITWR